SSGCGGGTRRFERRRWGSTPHGDTVGQDSNPAEALDRIGILSHDNKAGAARLAEHRSRKAARVGSTPTAGSCLSLPLPLGEGPYFALSLWGRGVRGYFFRCSSHGKSVRLKSGRSLARPQPPELGTRPPTECHSWDLREK